VELGRVVKPHGVRGELKVRLYWSESLVLSEVPSVCLNVDGSEAPRRFEIEHCRYVPKGVLLKLKGIDDPDAAEKLRNAVLSLPRHELPELAEDEYYLVDLIGAEVVGPRGRIGRVTEVLPYQSEDTLVIHADTGKRYEQPIREPWIERIDVASKRIALASEEGLIEGPG
jgi:16S rRNA processing protein RimM